MAKTKQESSGPGNFLKGVRSEFKKIIWPTKQEAIKYTVIVIIACIIVSIIVYLLDLVFANLLSLIV